MGLAVALGAVAFAVFGGTSSHVVDPVAQAATVSSGASGYRMRFSMEISSSAMATPMTATGGGTFEPRDHTGSLSLAMNFGNDPGVIQTLGSDVLTLHEVLKGTTIYAELPAALASAMQISGKRWVAVNLAKLAGLPGLSVLGSNPVSSDPGQMLQYLRAVSDSVVAEGHQVVDGVQTTHYRADLSLDRVAAALPSSDQAVAQQALSALEQDVQTDELPVDVWVDAHHLVRRIEMSIAPTLGGGETLDEVMTMDISDYGPQSPPSAPPADEVASFN